MLNLLKRLDQLRVWSEKLKPKPRFKHGELYPTLSVDLQLSLIHGDMKRFTFTYGDKRDWLYVFRLHDPRHYQFMYRYRGEPANRHTQLDFLEE